MRDRRVDKRKELSFSFLGIIQNLLWDICEAKHSLIRAITIVNLASFKLKESKPRNKVSFKTSHAFEIGYNLLKLRISNFLNFWKIIINNSSIICKYLIAELNWTQISNIKQRKISLNLTFFWTWLWALGSMVALCCCFLLLLIPFDILAIFIILKQIENLLSQNIVLELQNILGFWLFLRFGLSGVFVHKIDLLEKFGAEIIHEINLVIFTFCFLILIIFILWWS